MTTLSREESSTASVKDGGMTAHDAADYVGTIVRARCEERTPDRVFFTFEGGRVFVASRELPDSPAPGESLEIYIDGVTRHGLWVGSIDKIAPFRLYERLESCRKSDTDIEAHIVAADAHGLYADVESVLGFMPRREIGDDELAAWVGKTTKARILKFSPHDGQLVISRRAAMAETWREARETFLANLKPEQIYTGTVRQITDFGVFVDIGAGVEGLVHRSNLSWGNDAPAAVVSVGDSLRVTVLSIDKGRIALGHKQLVEDTWASVSQQLTPGDILEGKVTTFTSFGAFVRLQNGLEGLVHNSELSWDPGVHQASQILTLNQEVRVKLLSVDASRRRLRLSLRQLSSNPWQTLKDRMPNGTHLHLPIASISDFGIFIDLGSGLRGLIHKNDISWNDSPDPASQYHVGDVIDCVVLDIDVERERASLGIKQLTGDPWADFVAQSPLGQPFDVTICRLAPFGAFATIPVGQGVVEGLIHISELAPHRVSNIESVVHVGQIVTATVIDLDLSRRRIGLSLTAEPFDPDFVEEPEIVDAASHTPTMADIFPKDLIH